MSLPETYRGSRPCLVLAHAQAGQAEASCRHLHRLGWEVHPARTAAEARRLTRTLSPDVVVLDTELSDESGWLMCAKLTSELPGQRVILVGPLPTRERAEFASFVGAEALIPAGPGLPGRLEELVAPEQLGVAV